jgi:hypothetical protein
MAIYTKDMFATGNDVDNRATVKAGQTDQLDIVDLAFRCERKIFDKIVHSLKLHP